MVAAPFSFLAAPLTVRELQILGRRRSTYGLRVSCAAGGILMILAATWLTAAPYRELMALDDYERAYGQLSEQIARIFGAAITVFQISVVFLIAPFIGGTSIVRDRADGVLPLLQLTGARAFDVWLAKLLARFLQCELLLATTLPMLAVASLFGGLSVADMTHQKLILSLCCLAVASLSCLFSAYADSIEQALVTSLSTGVLLMCATFPVVPLFLIILVTHEEGMGMAWEMLVYHGHAYIRRGMRIISTDMAPDILQQYVVSAAVAMSVVVLFASVLGIRALARPERPRGGSSPKRRRARRAAGAALSTARLLLGDILPPGASRNPVSRVTAVIALVVVSAIPFGVGWLMVLFALVYVSAHAMRTVHESRALAEIAATPIDDIDLSQAIVGVSLSRARFCFLPMLAGAAWMVTYSMRRSAVGHSFTRLSHAGLAFDFETITWFLSAALIAAVFVVVLVLQAVTAIAGASTFSASGRHAPRSALLAMGLVTALFALTTAVPWAYVQHIQRGSILTYSHELAERATYGFIAGNVLFYALICYLLLHMLARRVRRRAE